MKYQDTKYISNSAVSKRHIYVFDKCIWAQSNALLPKEFQFGILINDILVASATSPICDGFMRLNAPQIEKSSLNSNVLFA